MWPFSQVEKSDSTLEPSDGLRAEIEILRQRARLTHKMSLVSLVMIVFCISVGVTLFLVAGRLISEEQSAEIDYISNVVFETNDYEHIGGRDSVQRIADSLESLERQFGSQDSSTKSANVPSTLLAELHKDMKNSQEKSDSWRKRVEDAISGITKDSGTQQLVSTTVTRIGTVTMLVFLVQILVSMYRYNSRLCAFYHSRADMIALADIANIKALANAADVVTPSSVDFGKEHPSPIGEIRKIVADVLGGMDKRDQSVNKSTDVDK